MKIFYAVQATGNGHISRAMELLPHLSNYGEVDIFLSGNNSHLPLETPVKYRSKGISLYYNSAGGLDYLKLVKGLQPFEVRKQIRDLPVEQYDLVLNDFDFITSMACARKRIPSIHFGHQASFVSPNTPRPGKKNRMGEWLLKNYVSATHLAGLHFRKYDDFISGPVIKKEILHAEPRNDGHVTVYLPSYCEEFLETVFDKFREFQFEIFSGYCKAPRQVKNIRFLPVDKKLFNNSLISCKGIITGGGFETPAEAIHLGKKVLCIPIRGQYEQQCNAAALSEMGIQTLSHLGDNFSSTFYSWIQNPVTLQIDYSRSIPDCMAYIFRLAKDMKPARHKKTTPVCPPEWSTA